MKFGSFANSALSASVLAVLATLSIGGGALAQNRGTVLLEDNTGNITPVTGGLVTGERGNGRFGPYNVGPITDNASLFRAISAGLDASRNGSGESSTVRAFVPPTPRAVEHAINNMNENSTVLDLANTLNVPVEVMTEVMTEVRNHVHAQGGNAEAGAEAVVGDIDASTEIGDIAGGNVGDVAGVAGDILAGGNTLINQDIEPEDNVWTALSGNPAAPQAINATVSALGYQCATIGEGFQLWHFGFTNTRYAPECRDAVRRASDSVATQTELTTAMLASQLTGMDRDQLVFAFAGMSDETAVRFIAAHLSTLGYEGVLENILALVESAGATEAFFTYLEAYAAEVNTAQALDTVTNDLANAVKVLGLSQRVNVLFPTGTEDANLRRVIAYGEFRAIMQFVDEAPETTIAQLINFFTKVGDPEAVAQLSALQEQN